MIDLIHADGTPLSKQERQEFWERQDRAPTSSGNILLLSGSNGKPRPKAQPKLKWPKLKWPLGTPKFLVRRSKGRVLANENDGGEIPSKLDFATLRYQLERLFAVTRLGMIMPRTGVSEGGFHKYLEDQILRLESQLGDHAGGYETENFTVEEFLEKLGPISPQEDPDALLLANRNRRGNARSLSNRSRPKRPLGGRGVGLRAFGPPGSQRRLANTTPSVKDTEAVPSKLDFNKLLEQLDRILTLSEFPIVVPPGLQPSNLHAWLERWLKLLEERFGSGDNNYAGDGGESLFEEDEANLLSNRNRRRGNARSLTNRPSKKKLGGRGIGRKAFGP